MKDILTVMKFTIKDMARRKSFIIATLIILILIVVGFNIPNIIKSFQGNNQDDKLLIVDNDNIFENNLELLKQEDLGYEIEIQKSDINEVREKIANEEIDEAIMIKKQENNIEIKYIVKNANFINEVPQTIVTAINTLYNNIQISKLGLTEEQLKSITPNFEFDIEQTDEATSGNVFIMMLMSIVLFYAIYFCAYQVSSSITTEKTSKIIETLVTSTKPKTIVIRKDIRNWNNRITSTYINCRNCFSKC